MGNLVGPMKIYPRGFLGAQMGPRIEKKTNPIAGAMGRLAFNQVDYQTSTTTVDANPNVEALYSQYIRNVPGVLSSNFDELVLIVATSAFGTPDFYHWFQQQLRSPVAAQAHRDFLDDTLRFILTGKRHLQVELWGNLVSLDDSGDKTPIMSEMARQFFHTYQMGNNIPQVDKYSRSLDHVLQRWLSQPGGKEDLLNSLHVLFGNVIP